MKYIKEWSWISHGNYVSNFSSTHFVEKSEVLAARRALTFYLEVCIANHGRRYIKARGFSDLAQSKIL